MRWPVTPSGRESLGALVALTAGAVVPWFVGLIHGASWSAVAGVAVIPTVVLGLSVRAWRDDRPRAGQVDQSGEAGPPGGT